MKSVRIIAGIQIVLAIVFAIVAWKIDPGVSRLSKQGAETCRQLTKTVQEHRTVYASAMQNVFPMAGAMRKVNNSLNQFSEQVDSLGKVIRKVPGKRFEGVAKGCFDTADAMRDAGKSVTGAANVIDNYRTAGYPQSLATFDNLTNALTQVEDVLKRSSRETRVVIQLLAVLGSLIFLLNAVALFLMNGKKASD